MPLVKDTRSKRVASQKICDCLLCVPVPGKRAHPEWGYDLDLVPSIHCLSCDEPIGGEPYVEDVGFVRFGDMLFYHKRCAPSGAEAEAARMVAKRGKHAIRTEG